MSAWRPLIQAEPVQGKFAPLAVERMQEMLQPIAPLFIHTGSSLLAFRPSSNAGKQAFGARQ